MTLFLLTGAVCGAFSLWFARWGHRVWHGKGRLPSARPGTLRLYNRKAMDRSLYVWAIAFGCMTVLSLEVVTVLSWVSQRSSMAVKILASVAGALPVVGVLVCVGLYKAIEWFNVPKWLVPPYLRSEQGTITAARARRRAVRSDSHGAS